MKLIGSIIIVSTSALLGIRKAWELDEACRELHALRQIMYMLESEIRYSCAFLGEAFLRISERMKQPYKAWLRQMNHCMRAKHGGAFYQIWEEKCQEYLGPLHIPREEQGAILDLGHYLNGSDREVQIKHIELLIQQLAEAEEEMRREIKTKKRLCRCMGVMGGIFLAILLL